MKTIQMWTDGACKGNPGPGGWCVHLRDEVDYEIPYCKTFSGNKVHTTNNEKVTEFLKKNNANAERVELTGATLWSVAVEEGKVIGVAGANIGKYADRIKGFFVIKEYRRKGIGTELLQDILGHTKAKKITAFCTRDSENLFVKNGFAVTRAMDKHGISFVERG